MMKQIKNINKLFKNSPFRGLGGLFLFFFVFSLSAVEPFRFVLLTDLHITPGALSVEDLENSVKQINNTPDIDFVLVTGDITETGDRASMQMA